MSRIGRESSGGDFSLVLDHSLLSCALRGLPAEHYLSGNRTVFSKLKPQVVVPKLEK